jgi:LPXTG-motif cell wall-anchored protein
LVVTVNEPPIYVKYSLFIIIGLVVALAAGGAVYFLKFREK